ncbi:ferredoxin family protein [bacterium]|nr:ferredoxin family protein [bacterium]
MAAKKLTVVISQAQGKNPQKRQLEEDLATELIMASDVDTSIVPHLYDMSHDHTGMLFLQSIPGDVVFLSWLYPRAARWTLDRAGVRGHEGISLLKTEDEDDEDFDGEEKERAADEDAEESKGIGSVDVPNRKLYCIDLRCDTDPKAFLTEIKRIASEKAVQTVGLMDWIQGSPKKEQLQRYLEPQKMLAAAKELTIETNDALPEPTKRRWYPVIDYSRCTNCMECIDFCLFGVYGIDKADRILVEQQDNCKKGCPACSRVCPENAIIFPQHKTPAIAGADGEVAGLKIDLSKLFGGGEGLSPLDLAVRERDTELVADGRDAVGAAVGLPKRQCGASDKPRDDLDDLMDGLDSLDF